MGTCHLHQPESMLLSHDHSDLPTNNCLNNKLLSPLEGELAVFCLDGFRELLFLSDSHLLLFWVPVLQGCHNTQPAIVIVTTLKCLLSVPLLELQPIFRMIS